MDDGSHSRRFMLFLLTGGLAALVNFGSRILYDEWFGFSAAIVLAYLTGMAVAFWLARLLVFPDSGQPLARSGGWFVLVNLAAVAQTWLISLWLVRWLPTLGVQRHVAELAHGIGVLVPVFTSYLGHRRWSFRRA